MDLQKIGEGGGLDSCLSEQEAVAGSCELCNEPSGSIEGGDFLDPWLTKRPTASQ
jgi:hypothetical protein